MAEEGFVGMSAVTAEFIHRGPWSRQKSYSLARHFGLRLVEEVKRNASGRPGPEEVTGEYVDSIYFEVTDQVAAGGEGASVDVGSDAPQALRLEYGFVGTDSLGRTYEQPPFPHWQPAMDVVEPEYEEAMTALADFDAVMMS